MNLEVDLQAGSAGLCFECKRLIERQVSSCIFKFQFMRVRARGCRANNSTIQWTTQQSTSNWWTCRRVHFEINWRSLPWWAVDLQVYSPLWPTRRRSNGNLLLAKSLMLPKRRTKESSISTRNSFDWWRACRTCSARVLDHSPGPRLQAATSSATSKFEYRKMQ